MNHRPGPNIADSVGVSSIRKLAIRSGWIGAITGVVLGFTFVFGLGVTTTLVALQPGIEA